jgi:hypothetical protein
VKYLRKMAEAGDLADIVEAVQLRSAPAPLEADQPDNDPPSTPDPSTHVRTIAEAIAAATPDHKPTTPPLSTSPTHPAAHTASRTAPPQPRHRPARLRALPIPRHRLQSRPRHLPRLPRPHRRRMDTTRPARKAHAWPAQPMAP